jgi:nicotinamidase-related amidase
MTKPARTLLDLAGRRFPPAVLQEASLVVIDAQREYVDGAVPLDGVDAALAEIAVLLDKARGAGVPIVHVVQLGKSGGLFDPETAGRVDRRALPIAGEAIIGKPRPCAFAGTDLDFILRGHGRRDLILVGFMTHMCVSSTARMALDLGYRTTVVASATATRNLPGLDGEVPAAAIQRAALAALGDRFSVIVPNVAALVR